MVRRLLPLCTLLLLTLACGPAAFAQAPIRGQVLVQLRPNVDIARINAKYRTRTVSQAPGTAAFLLSTPPGADVTRFSARLLRDPRVLKAEPNRQTGRPGSGNPRPGNPPPGNPPPSNPPPSNPPPSNPPPTNPPPSNPPPTNPPPGNPPPGNPPPNYPGPPGSSTGSQGMPDPEDTQWSTTFDTPWGPIAYNGQMSVSQINYPQQLAARGGGVLVAVLDSGISSRHAHLRERLAPGWNFIDNNTNTEDFPAQIDTNGNGIRDEGAGHGTAVAGLIARIAPDARLLPVKVLNSDGAGTVWHTVQGIHFAVAHGAKIINLSLGTLQDSGLIAEALQDAHKKGVLIVASAGNDDTDRKQYPAAFSFTVTVAALAPDNTKASFSNYGSGVDVCAPGVDVVSTFWDGSYVQWSGTSFAAGIISGVAAVVASHAPRLKVDEVARAIIRSGRSVDAENPQYRGKLGPSDGGLVDVTAALAAADARGEGGGGGGAPDNGGGAPDDGDGPDDDDDDDGDGGGRGRGRDGRRPR